MLPIKDHCVDCVPGYFKDSASGLSSSSLLFALTFLLVAVGVHQKIYPLLSPPNSCRQARSGTHSVASSRNASASSYSRVRERRSYDRLCSIVFSSTIGLSAVLTELLLCEISNSFDPAARKVAIRITVASLVASLVVLIPLLEIYSVIAGAGWRFIHGTKAGARVAWGLVLTGYTLFLFAFWLVGTFLPDSTDVSDSVAMNPASACLERLAITGTLMMAILSGFAAISAIWHNFARRDRMVTDTDITRKQAGLDGILDMLAIKETRLQQLESKLSELPSQGFFQKAIGSIRGSSELQELKTLELEVSGLRGMSASLENSLFTLQTRRASQLRASTALGRVTTGFSYLFSCYCVYRVASSIIGIARRIVYPTLSLASSDPVTNTITLFARLVYPSLNQAAWSRQVSFGLSGIILLASFNAVLQTFYLFTRFLPGMLQASKTNIALFVGQVSGLYVISSAVMLRNVMPEDVGGVVSDALGTGVLQPIWTEKWFEGWFLGAAAMTSLGIWLGQKMRGDVAWDDDGWDADVEIGKRS